MARGEWAKLCANFVDMANTSRDTDYTTVRLPRRIVEDVREIAKAHDRSLSAELRVALAEYVRRSAPELEESGPGAVPTRNREGQ